MHIHFLKCPYVELNIANGCSFFLFFFFVNINLIFSPYILSHPFDWVSFQLFNQLRSVLLIVRLFINDPLKVSLLYSFNII